MNNKNKPTRFEAIFIIALFLLICGFGILDRYSNGSSYTEVEAQSPQRFEFQAVGKWGWNGESNPRTYNFVVASICDTKYGNLIYVSGGSQSSPAVVPNGCPKNQSK